MLRKLYLISVFTLVLSGLAHAQLDIYRQNTVGGNQSDLFAGAVRTSDGGWMLAGSSTSGISGDKSSSNKGDADFWLIRTDSNGNILWDSTYGGSDEDICTTILPLADGSFILAGYSSSGISGNKSTVNYGFTDYWVIRVDSLGNKIWDRNLGSNLFDFLTSAIITNDGKIVLGGYSNSSSNSIKTQNSKGSFDYWIIKIDTGSTGIIWQNTIGGLNADKAMSLLELPDYSILITGSSSSGNSGDKTSASYGLDDFWMVRVSATGTILNQFSSGGSSNDVAISSVFLPDGSFLFTGESDSPISGVKTTPSFGGKDIWAIRTNSAGIQLWEGIWGSSGDDNLVKSIENLGKIYIAGTTPEESGGNKTAPLKGGKDIWMISTDYLLQEIYQTTIGGNADDQLANISFDTAGVHMMINSTSGNSADKDEGCRGAQDFWLVSAHLTENFSRIEGSLFYDLDSNLVWDANELPIKYRRVTINGGNAFAFTNSNGSYYYNVLDTGTTVLEPNFINFLECVPQSDTVTIFTPATVVSNVNFGYKPISSISDLAVSLIPVGPFRAGDNCKFQITCTNLGFLPIGSPAIQFYGNSYMSFLSATIAPALNNGDTLEWQLPPMYPFQQHTIDAFFHIGTSTPIGTSLHNFATVFDPSTTDINPFNNNATWEIHTTGSYDPNDITPSKDSIPDSLLSQPPVLTYLIRFQNTGNDTAFYVNIKNKIENTLIDTSLEIISSSHPMEVSYNPVTRLAEFTFNDILLPDSNVNEPESHGFVMYSIRPVSTLSLSDTIKNSAGIYFDYNPVVLTNTATTVFYHPASGVGVAETLKYPEQIFPNPARDQLYVRFDPRNPMPVRIKITDLSGRTIKINSLRGTLELTLGITELSSGVYFLETTYEDGIQSNHRFVVENE